MTIATIITILKVACVFVGVAAALCLVALALEAEHVEVVRLP